MKLIISFFNIDLINDIDFFVIGSTFFSQLALEIFFFVRDLRFFGTAILTIF